MKDEPRKQSGGGLSLKTLLIAGAASATAALVVPLFWKPGTVFAAAMTPIIVALVQELLRKPAETVSAVTARRTAGGGVIFDRPSERRPFDPLAPAPTEELETLPRTTSQRTVTARRRVTPRQVRLALLTGLVAFAGAVTVVTASEMLAGESVGGGRNPTTFFGRSTQSEDRRTEDGEKAKEMEKEKATPTATPSASATPEATGTPTPTPTATPTPAPSVTEAPESAAPASPTPAP